MLRRVAQHCGMLRYVALWCTIALRCAMLRYVALCCATLRYVALCCGVLRYVALHCAMPLEQSEPNVKLQSGARTRLTLISVKTHGLTSAPRPSMHVVTWNRKADSAFTFAALRCAAPTFVVSMRCQ